MAATGGFDDLSPALLKFFLFSCLSTHMCVYTIKMPLTLFEGEDEQGMIEFYREGKKKAGQGQ